MDPKQPSKEFIEFTSEKPTSLHCECPLCVGAENVSCLGQTTHDPNPGRTEFWRWDKSHSRLVLKRRSSDSIDSVKVCIFCVPIYSLSNFDRRVSAFQASHRHLSQRYISIPLQRTLHANFLPSSWPYSGRLRSDLADVLL
jgi:hypothetical protein